MDEDEQIQQAICAMLQQLPTSINIAPYNTCFGGEYYEWWVGKGEHEIEASFLEALEQVFNALLTPPRKRSA